MRGNSLFTYPWLTVDHHCHCSNTSLLRYCFSRGRPIISNMFLQASLSCNATVTEVSFCVSFHLGDTPQEAVAKLVASVTAVREERPEGVLETSSLIKKACKRFALEHPLAQGRVDPAFAYAITHHNVTWAHSGLYNEDCLPRLTVTDEIRQELWNAAVDDYIAKGTDQRPVEEVRG